MKSELAPTPFITLPDEQEVTTATGTAGGWRRLEFTPAMSRLLFAHSEIGPTFGAHSAQVMNGPGSLSRAEREMIAAVASAAQDCHY